MSDAAEAIREEIAALETRLEDLRTALQLIEREPAAAASPAVRYAAVPARGHTSGRRAGRGQRRQQVVDALGKTPVGPSQIAKTLGISPTQVSTLLNRLQQEKVAKKTADGWVRA